MAFQKDSKNLELVKVNKIPNKGRGIRAAKSIKKGELIEASPTCSFPSEQRKIIDNTSLFDYYFVRNAEYQDTEKQATGYMVFGLASLCNHTDKPNAIVEWDENDTTGVWAHLIALEDIQTGEEIMISYANINEYPTDNFVNH